MADLLILTDGGGRIGLGHIIRCVAIHRAWSFGSSKLLVSMEEAAQVPSEAHHFDWKNRLSEIQSMVTDNTLVLVDSYQVEHPFFLRLRKYFSFIAVLDDFNRISYPVDLIVCPGIYGHLMNYQNQRARTFGGAEYVIIRQDIIAARRKIVRKNFKNILITFGGSQQNESLYQQALNIFSDTDYDVTVVTGNEFLVSKLCTKAKVFGKLDSNTMAKLMASADIAICAAGQTLNEFSWLGIPAFTFKTTEDQEGNWRYYQQFSLALGSYSCDESDLRSKIHSKLASLSTANYNFLSTKLKSLFNQNGAKEVCLTINNIWDTRQ